MLDARAIKGMWQRCEQHVGGLAHASDQIRGIIMDRVDHPDQILERGDALANDHADLFKSLLIATSS